MKTTTINKYYGLEYVTLKDVPLVDTEHGPAFHSQTIKALDRLVCIAIISRGIPLRGKEVKFLRKACGLSLADFGAMLGLTAPAIKKWEDAVTTQLSFVNQIAVRAIMLREFRTELDVKRVVQVDPKPKKIELSGRAVA